MDNLVEYLMLERLMLHDFNLKMEVIKDDQNRTGIHFNFNGEHRCGMAFPVPNFKLEIELENV